MSKYMVFTDGGCRGNGKQDAVGAWAFIVYKENGERVGSQSAGTRGVTNNQMEIKAVLKALTWANKHSQEIEIYLDSNYVKQACESWIWAWKKKGWIKSDGGELLNKDLWQQVHAELNKYMEIHKEIPTFIKVKGHSGHEQNDAVDNLCNVRMTEVEMEDI